MQSQFDLLCFFFSCNERPPVVFGGGADPRCRAFAKLPKKRKTVLFSATMSKNVNEVARGYQEAISKTLFEWK